MKFIKSICLLLLFAAPLLVFSQHVKFEQAFPEAGSIVKFTYNPAGTKLSGQQKIDCKAFVFAKKQPGPTVVNLVKVGELYEADLPTTDSTTLVALTFSSGEIKDSNAEGYYVKLSEKGKIPGEAYTNEAYLYDFFGSYYLGMKTNPEKAVSAYEEGFKIKPELKEKYLSSYLGLKYRINKEAGGKLIEENISRLLAIQPEAEKNLAVVHNLYGTLKQKAKSDTLKNRIITRFPKGSLAFGSALNELYSEKSATVTEQKLNELIQKFDLDLNKKSDQDKVAMIFQKLAGQYAREKNYDKFKIYADKISNKIALAGLYNSVAWPLAEKNEQSSFAADLSKKSLDLIDAAKKEPVPEFYPSREEYFKGLNRSYAMYADTYALLLHNLGKNAEAVVYQEKAMPFNDAAGNERYVTYLDLSGSKDKAFTMAESFLKAGKGTDKMKERFRVLYENKKLKLPFETFIAGVEKEAMVKEREEWSKKMINEPAPDFSLVNLKGETVRLSALKGKVVIVDYWATWCGPCVASFPGMQKAVTKYADNPNVVFLFVNTWQTEDNREKLVKDFIAEKKVTFNVLFDTKNKQDPSKFDIVSAYKVDGIPTKFIIGPDGNIRFKSVGFSGSADAVVKELDTMIGLSSHQSK
ncbi:peroxiredoxin [Pedobacter africanus]|uniref:Peroxiredoxin n=1 Tax=Pedobacter africanus TaxID=151894 RepID=A0ACC6L269_9SPHI|nr:TlpA disulfide reductase family protein [Pedobacter africanus]MDR6785467.1 peroxiredoxin [Pedobacter africanus]